MRATVLCLILGSATTIAAQSLSVSVCNLGDMPESDLRRAESEATAVFRSAGVEILWRGCDDSPAPGEHSITIRLRNDKPPVTTGSMSLDAMGRAFLGDNGHGYLADTYYQAVSDLAGRHQADAAVLLGFVIAHEIGHLLLGPGHVSDGVMRTGWNVSELQALRQRWLRFNQAESARIRQALQ